MNEWSNQSKVGGFVTNIDKNDTALRNKRGVNSMNTRGLITVVA